METEQKSRHELKYVINAGQKVICQSRLQNLLLPDAHGDAEGKYHVRSLYFDDYNNRCFYENENGTDPREKFRIRIYNSDVSRIILECKRKERGKTRKQSCLLSQEQTRELMKGVPLSNISQQPPLLQKLTAQMLTRRLRPVVIVEYDRIPYIYKAGNVRITLDGNISASAEVGGFLESQIPKRPVMSVGQSILEVKYDEFLPDFVYQSLQLPNLTQTAFSKYYICRKFIG